MELLETRVAVELPATTLPRVAEEEVDQVEVEVEEEEAEAVVDLKGAMLYK
jgi:hypothetical protein